MEIHVASKGTLQWRHRDWHNWKRLDISTSDFAKSAVSAEEQSMSADNKILIRRFVDALNSGSPSALEEFISADYVYHNPALPDVKDFATLKQFNAMSSAAFPDLHFNIEDLIAEGDKIVYRYSATGTHKGALSGIPATGNTVTITGMVISRIANSKVQEDWEQTDMLGLMQQLGGIPKLA